MRLGSPLRRPVVVMSVVRSALVECGPMARARLDDGGKDVFAAGCLADSAHRFVSRSFREPDDIGMVIAMLVSDEGRWITGQDIEVSGGQNL